MPLGASSAGVSGEGSHCANTYEWSENLRKLLAVLDI